MVSPNEGERNYHIFYQLARGATPSERAALKVKGVEEFGYLTSGGMPATFVDGVDDTAEFHGACGVGACLCVRARAALLRASSSRIHVCPPHPPAPPPTPRHPSTRPQTCAPR